MRLRGLSARCRRRARFDRSWMQHRLRPTRYSVRVNELVRQDWFWYLAGTVCVRRPDRAGRNGGGGRRERGGPGEADGAVGAPAPAGGPGGTDAMAVHPAGVGVGPAVAARPVRLVGAPQLLDRRGVLHRAARHVELPLPVRPRPGAARRAGGGAGHGGDGGRTRPGEHPPYIFASLWLRALYGTTRGALLHTGFLAVAVVVALWVWTLLPGRPDMAPAASIAASSTLCRSCS